MATPVTHVIFDIDGLLLDTESLYTEITQKIVGEYDKVFTWDIKAKQMGKKENESVKVLIDALQLPLTIEEYKTRSHELQNKLFPTVKKLPGAEKLVRHLKEQNIPICVATGSDKRSYGLKSKNHKELFELFDHAVLSGDDPECKYGKPAPDCFLLAAKRFPDNPDPSKVLVFEDAPNGLDAAHAAGMQCVWIPHKELDKEAHKHKATQILESLEDFKPEDFGLPPYTS